LAFGKGVDTRSLKKLPGGDKGFEAAYKEWWNREGRDLDAALSNRGVRRISPSQSFIWESLDHDRDGMRTNGLTGNRARYYSYDWGGGGSHGSQIEILNRYGKHLGSIDPITGKKISDPNKEHKKKNFRADLIPAPTGEPPSAFG
jgi:hypothetical protein